MVVQTKSVIWYFVVSNKNVEAHISNAAEARDNSYLLVNALGMTLQLSQMNQKCFLSTLRNL